MKFLIFIFLLASNSLFAKDTKNSFNLLGSGIGHSSQDGLVYSLGLNYERELNKNLAAGLGFVYGENIYGPQAYLDYSFKEIDKNGLFVGALYRKTWSDFNITPSTSVSTTNDHLFARIGYQLNFGKNDRFYFRPQVAFDTLNKFKTDAYLTLGIRF